MIKKTKNLIFAVTLTCLARTASFYAMQPFSQQKEKSKDNTADAFVAAPRIATQKNILCEACFFENKLELKECFCCGYPLKQEKSNMPHHNNKGVKGDINPQKRQREASQKATQSDVLWHGVNPEQHKREEELLQLALQMSLEPIDRPADALHEPAQTVQQSTTYCYYSCPACTFVNLTIHPFCAFCETQNPVWNNNGNLRMRISGRTLNLLQLADQYRHEEDGPY